LTLRSSVVSLRVWSAIRLSIAGGRAAFLSTFITRGEKARYESGFPAPRRLAIPLGDWLHRYTVVCVHRESPLQHHRIHFAVTPAGSASTTERTTRGMSDWK
jgi:hypothetical protein